MYLSNVQNIFQLTCSGSQIDYGPWFGKFFLLTCFPPKSLGDKTFVSNNKSFPGYKSTLEIWTSVPESFRGHKPESRGLKSPSMSPKCLSPLSVIVLNTFLTAFIWNTALPDCSPDTGQPVKLSTYSVHFPVFRIWERKTGTNLSIIVTEENSCKKNWKEKIKERNQSNKQLRVGISHTADTNRNQCYTNQMTEL